MSNGIAMAAGTDARTTPSLKVAALASAGAAVEWYDFFLYGTAAALVFPKLFFPADLPPFVAQIAAFSTFMVGFIARPIGASLFGHLGDKRGHKPALVLAMLMMGGATTLIGLLPTYEMVGSLAPLLLVILRFVQGLAVGGQWGGAALMTLENAPPNRRGFYTSFVQIGVPLGVVLANSVFLIASAMTTSEQFVAWGWRIGFVISVVLIIIGLYMHWSVREPASASVETEAGRTTEPGPTTSPLLTVLREHWRTVLLAGGAFIANNVCFYIAITYAISYGTSVVGISREVLLFAVMAASVLMIPVLIACGAWSDRHGRLGIFLWGAILSGAWAFAFFPLIETGSTIAVVAAITATLVFTSMMYGPQAALFAELFPKHVRYSGASLGYQIGSVFGGGFAPIIATALYAEFGTSLSISCYLLAVCMLTVVSVLMLRSRSASYAT